MHEQKELLHEQSFMKKQESRKRNTEFISLEYRSRKFKNKIRKNGAD